MTQTPSRAGQLEAITEADTEETIVNQAPRTQGCLNELIRIFPTLAQAAQEAVLALAKAYDAAR